MRLKAEQISCFRGDRLVLDQVSCAVAAGGALLLLGPNGAGKSTFLRVLAGLKRFDAGVVTFDGTAEYAGAAAYLGHQDAVKPGLTAAENLRFASRIGGGDAGAALHAAGLAPLADLPARLLSAGQKRRLALARLAVQGAALWLLDEPTVGLDGAAIGRFGVALAAHRARGGVVVAATHVDLPLPGADILHLATDHVPDAAPDPAPGPALADLAGLAPQPLSDQAHPPPDRRRGSRAPDRSR